MKKLKSTQITIRKSYSRAYTRQVGKAEKIMSNRRKLSKKIRKARKIFERLKNIPRFDAFSKNICSLCDLLSDYIEGIYQKAPLATIIAVVAGLLYLVLPFDVLADYIPVLGWLDDAAILAFVIAAEQNDIKEYLAWKACQTMVVEDTITA